MHETDDPIQLRLNKEMKKNKSINNQSGQTLPELLLFIGALAICIETGFFLVSHFGIEKVYLFLIIPGIMIVFFPTAYFLFENDFIWTRILFFLIYFSALGFLTLHFIDKPHMIGPLLIGVILAFYRPIILTIDKLFSKSKKKR